MSICTYKHTYIQGVSLYIVIHPVYVCIYIHIYTECITIYSETPCIYVVFIYTHIDTCIYTWCFNIYIVEYPVYMCVYIHTHTYIYIQGVSLYMCVYTHIQGVSTLVDITAGGDFLGLRNQNVHINMCPILDGYGVMTA